VAKSEIEVEVRKLRRSQEWWTYMIPELRLSLWIRNVISANDFV
jgi:hypothetical protein